MSLKTLIFENIDIRDMNEHDMRLNDLKVKAYEGFFIKKNLSSICDARKCREIYNLTYKLVFRISRF